MKIGDDMLKIFALVSCNLIVLLNARCDDEMPIYKTYALTPTIDANFSNQIYIPKDLDDCIVELEKLLPPDLAEDINQSNDVFKYHLNLGVWIRNHWGLWKGSRLSDYFNRRGVTHPGDMSHIILAYFKRYLK